MEPWAIEFIQIIPSILWFLLAVIILILFYSPIRNDVLPKLSGLKAMGVEFSFVKESINDAIELAEKSEQWNIKVTEQGREKALDRAKHHLAIFKGAKLLWVDDSFENNKNERKMFGQLKMEIDTASTTEEALRKLEKNRYDVVISDMVREGEKIQTNVPAGLSFLQKLRDRADKTRVIFYVGVLDPEKGVPANAFGITNRPDELLHLVLDALERKKY